MQKKICESICSGFEMAILVQKKLFLTCGLAVLLAFTICFIVLYQMKKPEEELNYSQLTFWFLFVGIFAFCAAFAGSFWYHVYKPVTQYCKQCPPGK